MFGGATIRYQGAAEAFVVESMPVDAVVWERTTKRKVGDGKGIGFEDMARVTFLALRRMGEVQPEQTFDDWLGSLAEYSPTAADPSQPVADPQSE